MTSEWDTMPAMNVEYRLHELLRVPADVAKAIRHRLENVGRQQIEIDFLKRRIAFLEQHVPEDIRNPPQTADTTRWTGD